MRRILSFLNTPNALVALGALLGLTLSLIGRLAANDWVSPVDVPSLAVTLLGGGYLVFRLFQKALQGEFGADWLAGLSIITSLFLGEYLAGALVVLMLSGGESVEAMALGRASSVLSALANRMPSVAHRAEDEGYVDCLVTEVQPGDRLLVQPFELCPVDGVVIEGHTSMDESYLTGEPYFVEKAPGVEVLSGAVNGSGVVTVRALRKAKDSRYAQIMSVMEESKQKRPRMRRLGDLLGALYTPLALAIAVTAWWLSGDARRFLAVLVVATPCPLLIAIPVAIVGAISWCAKRGILIKDPVVLERASQCRVLITDKTGTLTVGEPTLVSVQGYGSTEDLVLTKVASVEKYSKHPLAAPILRAAEKRGLSLESATEVSEEPGKGLKATVGGDEVVVCGRKSLSPAQSSVLSPPERGLECIAVLNGIVAGVLRFRDEPRSDSRSFIDHLTPRHSFSEVILLSGDRETEVKGVAESLGIVRSFAGKSPEEKVAFVRAETEQNHTMYLGDGINDAPALLAASVGVALGPRSDITSEAAGAVIMEASLRRVDQLLHISAHLRSVILLSAVGGMGASVMAMGLASAGLLNAVSGAIVQEAIDLFAVLYALRAAMLSDSVIDLR
jgi:heavy metal translocating P-type ATPase